MDADFTPIPYFEWKPLPDPRKPPLPYQAGEVFQIRRHIPPQPFGFCYDKRAAPRPKASEDILGDIVHSDWCLTHPPTETPPHSDQSIYTLRIVDQLACEDGRGAQVVRCVLDKGTRHLVAKIYDPLYYAYQHRSFRDPVDVTHAADQDYSHEAAVYEELDKAKVAGQWTPEYYGSWTTSIVFPDRKRSIRPVRLILLECVHGHNLGAMLSAETYTSVKPKQRLLVLAKAMEAWTMLDFHGVNQRDFAPRNVMLLDSNLDEKQPKVKLIDFNVAAVYSRPWCRFESLGTPKPVSPRYRFWSRCPQDWMDWAPRPHCSRAEVFLGWLTTMWPECKERWSTPTEELKATKDYSRPIELCEPQEDGPGTSTIGLTYL